jgi:hypothetical protein
MYQRRVGAEWALVNIHDVAVVVVVCNCISPKMCQSFSKLFAIQDSIYSLLEAAEEQLPS